MFFLKSVQWLGDMPKFGDIKPSDYLKLKFDAFLLKNKGYRIGSYLIYPKIEIDEKNFSMLVDDNSIFEFNILEIDMKFKKDINSLCLEFK